MQSHLKGKAAALDVLCLLAALPLVVTTGAAASRALKPPKEKITYVDRVLLQNQMGPCARFLERSRRTITVRKKRSIGRMLKVSMLCPRYHTT